MWFEGEQNREGHELQSEQYLYSWGVVVTGRLLETMFLISTIISILLILVKIIILPPNYMISTN